MTNIVKLVVDFLSIKSIQRLRLVCRVLADDFFDASYMRRIDGPFRLRPASQTTNYTPLVYTSLPEEDQKQMVFQLARWIVLGRADRALAPQWPLTVLFPDCGLTITERLNVEVAFVYFVNRYPLLRNEIEALRSRANTLVTTQPADEDSCERWTTLVANKTSFTTKDVFTALRWPSWMLVHEEWLIHPANCDPNRNSPLTLPHGCRVLLRL